MKADAVKVGEVYRFNTRGCVEPSVYICTGRVLEKLDNGRIRVELTENTSSFPSLSGTPAEPGDVLRLDVSLSVAEPV